MIIDVIVLSFDCLFSNALVLDLLCRPSSSCKITQGSVVYMEKNVKECAGAWLARLSNVKDTRGSYLCAGAWLARGSLFAYRKWAMASARNSPSA